MKDLNEQTDNPLLVRGFKKDLRDQTQLDSRWIANFKSTDHYQLIDNSFPILKTFDENTGNFFMSVRENTAGSQTRSEHYYFKKAISGSKAEYRVVMKQYADNIVTGVPKTPDVNLEIGSFENNIFSEAIRSYYNSGGISIILFRRPKPVNP